MLLLYATEHNQPESYAFATLQSASAATPNSFVPLLHAADVVVMVVALGLSVLAALKQENVVNTQVHK